MEYVDFNDVITCLSYGSLYLNPATKSRKGRAIIED